MTSPESLDGLLEVIKMCKELATNTGEAAKHIVSNAENIKKGSKLIHDLSLAVVALDERITNLELKLINQELEKEKA